MPHTKKIVWSPLDTRRAHRVTKMCQTDEFQLVHEDRDFRIWYDDCECVLYKERTFTNKPSEWATSAALVVHVDRVEEED